VTAVSAGGHPTYAIASGLYCWGDNERGELGDGSRIPSANRGAGNPAGDGPGSHSGGRPMRSPAGSIPQPDRHRYSARIDRRDAAATAGLSR
jgi:hypothetical protein